MPRKTALEASECETDEVDEVKAAWRLTSEEDNMMEDCLSGEDEEEEEDGGEMISGIDGGGMIPGEQQPAATLMEMLSASSCSSIDVRKLNKGGEGRILNRHQFQFETFSALFLRFAYYYNYMNIESSPVWKISALSLRFAYYKELLPVTNANAN